MAGGHGGPGPHLHRQDGVGQDARLPPALLPQDGSASRIHITSVEIMRFKTVLWILIRIDLAVPDPDPYWECGSGSRSMEFYQINLVSCLLKRLFVVFYLRRYVLFFAY